MEGLEGLDDVGRGDVAYAVDPAVAHRSVNNDDDVLESIVGKAVVTIANVHVTAVKVVAQMLHFERAFGVKDGGKVAKLRRGFSHAEEGGIGANCDDVGVVGRSTKPDEVMEVLGGEPYLCLVPCACRVAGAGIWAV